MLLSVLFNNSSPVVSKDEEGQRKRRREGEGGRKGGEAGGLREGKREKCRVDKLILFCDKKES